jgi:TM2 domain-containing membrane protein YozV
MSLRTVNPTAFLLPLLVPVCLLTMPSPGVRATEGAPRSGTVTARQDTSRIITPSGALLRSAIVPGWGQIYTGHTVKGVVMMVADAAIIGLAIHADTRVKDLAAIRGRNGAEEDALEMWRKRRQNRIVLAVGLILYSMADAFVDAHLLDFEDDDARFGMEVEPPPVGGTTPGLRLTLTLPIGRSR